MRKIKPIMNINPVIRWWMTPKLPEQDIFGLPLLVNKNLFSVAKHTFSQWAVHPIKRRLARLYLSLLQKYTNIVVVGITGSAGKSTTVQMLSSILKISGKTLATPPSIDPVYNVPNTILRCMPGTKYLILEMSVEYPGEMDYYLWLARPDIGVITNIFPSHLQHLGSIEGVLKEKGKLVLNLPATGVAVLNKGSKELASLSSKLKAKVLWVSYDADPNVQDGLIAKTVAEYLGAGSKEIETGLKNYKKPSHRLETIKHGSGAVILDDSYNSNPQAALSALKYFNKMAGSSRKVAILGDMLELGVHEEESHRLLGREVAGSNFALVVGVGKASKYMVDEIEKRSKHTKTHLVSDAKMVAPLVKPLLTKGTYLLVKGSRSIGLDKVIDDLS